MATAGDSTCGGGGGTCGGVDLRELSISSSNSPQPPADHHQHTPSSAAITLYRDALQGVFSFLSLREFVPAARCCRSWYEAGLSIQPRREKIRLHPARLENLLSSPMRRHVVSLNLDCDDGQRMELLRDESVSRLCEALTTIFHRFATVDNPPAAPGDQHKTMTKEDMRRYILSCGADVADERLTRIFTQFAVDGWTNHEQLTLDGFCAFYRDAIIDRPENVWGDLRTHGFTSCGIYPLTTRFREVLTIIFRRFATIDQPGSSEKIMSRADLRRYFLSCGLGVHVNFILTTILAAGAIGDGLTDHEQLNLDDFCEYYNRGQSDVWSNLFMQGFHNDLSEIEDVALSSRLNQLHKSMPQLHRLRLHSLFGGSALDTLLDHAAPIESLLLLLPNLKKLRVTFLPRHEADDEANWRVLQRGMEAIALCSSLTTLKVDARPIYSASRSTMPVSVLEPLSRLRDTLTTLEWARTFTTHPWLKEHVQVLRSLRCLTEVRCDPWTAEELEWFTADPAPRLCKIYIERLTSNQAPSVARLTTLREISLLHPRVTDTSFFASLTLLEHVDIRCDGGVTVGVDLLTSSLAKCSQIRTLALSYHPILTDEHLATLFAQLPQLSQLRLSHLANLRSLRCLRAPHLGDTLIELSITHCFRLDGVTLDDVRHLSRLSVCRVIDAPTIEELLTSPQVRTQIWPRLRTFVGSHSKDQH